MPQSYSPIGQVRSCFREKFGTPRQSLLVSEAHAVLKLRPDPQFRDALDGLSGFSHLWLIYEFHQHADQPWRARIEPPRVEVDKIGVFASRSPHRPNPLGLSAVKLERIDLEAKGGIELHLSGVDLLDGTPVLDIKPYLPYADSIPGAKAGWASEEITRYAVDFSPESLRDLGDFSSELFPRPRELIAGMLALDPRPASQRRTMPLTDPKTEGAVFRFRVAEFDVEWKWEKGSIRVLRLHRLKAT